ncbi:unnamed protein product [Onchocerca flexuosa]|uniref:Uncharacterized protein n=1 Tax=Onchocerca flexuosa TaxID=387005 RepID=A0A183I750_9BILA|nr:unnamed protein product [Onchocerca flexuosa]
MCTDNGLISSVHFRNFHKLCRRGTLEFPLRKLMLGEQIRQGFSPLIAVLTTDAVERIAAKNNLSFTDLLLPFATVNCTLKVAS